MRPWSGLNTDLRHSAAINSLRVRHQIVHDRVLREWGMIAWTVNLRPSQIENIRLYAIKRANEEKQLEDQSAKMAAR